MARSNSVPLEKSNSASRDMGNNNNSSNINAVTIDNNVGTFEFEVGSFNRQNHDDGHEIVSSADVNNLLLFATKSLSTNDFQANRFVPADIDVKPSMIIQCKQRQAIPISVLDNSSSTDNDEISYNKILMKASSTLNNEDTTNCSSAINNSNTSTLISKEDKVCVVCGDRALGCNFDVVSCESCKAFFRRNAHKEKEMKCIFDGCCYINVHTRRFCSYCRLKQCMQAGMRKE
ncbi:hypothetical protein HELRODRAFT_99849, partial [Helobdella robusta]|uniref:Nuclear receptor domain-containing protein n=1 Tax=Helobdella robusta TaxID=6412 RepID=T1G9V5_HELRO